MIPRYTRPDMDAIWQPENRFQIWLDIEIYAAQAMEKLGIIPRGVAAKTRKKGKFSVARIDKIEKETKHDVIAFLTNIAEHVGPEARFIHQGMTSSDVVDTCFSVQLTQAADILLDDLERVLRALKKRANQYKKTICVGRSHGIHAEPTTFGLKLLGHYAAFERCHARLMDAQAEVAVCMISGPVGTHASVHPLVQKHVAKKMGLSPEPVSTQVIPRDRYANYFATLGVIASCMENLATEIRHLQRTEVREAQEFFAKGQKGSSAMPHKKNPILSENICGLARLVRGYAIPAMENVALWHERDISHSSVERVIGPDATLALDFGLSRLANVIENLLVYPKRMKANLDSMGGLVFSQRVLLALTQSGINREDAYKIVQKNAMKVWDSDGKESFAALLKADKRVSEKLTDKQIDKIFSTDFYTAQVDRIFRGVLG